MKKFDFPLFADTLFLFAAAGLLSLCLFRFYLPLAPALGSELNVVWKKYQVFSPAARLLLREMQSRFAEKA